MTTRFAPCRDTDLVSVVRGCKCRCRGGKGGCVQPCEDLYISGSNTLRDAGFESQLGTFGSGPNLANDIPHNVSTATSVLFRWPETTDGIFANDPPLGDDTYWFQDFTNTLTGRWSISTANPRSGSSHARIVSPGLADLRNLYPTRVFCNPNKSGGFVQFWYTAIVQPGDLMTFSIWATANGAADIVISGQWLGLNRSFTGSFTQVQQSLSGSYAQKTNSQIAPAGAAAVQIFIWVEDAGGVTIDVDDASMVIS